MPFLMKLTYSADGQFESFRLHGPEAGETTEWGTIDRHGDEFKSSGDVKFFREGGLSAGAKGLIVERQSSTRRFVAAVEIVDMGFMGDDCWRPRYRVLERFDGSPPLQELRALDPVVNNLPQFRKNEPGMMLRSFLPLSQRDFDRIVKLLRRHRR